MRPNGPQHDRVTLAEVAERAGVSETTASHALTGRRHVATATRARVLLAVRELGYRPNQVARSLRIRSTQTVAFIVNDIGNVSLTTSIRGASALLRERGYATDMVDSPDEGLSLQVVQQVLDRLPDGMIFFGEEPNRRVAEPIELAGVPFVVGGLGAAHRGTSDVVYTDQERAVMEVTARLAAHTTGRICFFGGDTGDEGADARLRGFRAALTTAGRVPRDEDIVLVPYSIDGGAAAMRRVLHEPPGLLVAGSDQIAQGALIVAHEVGIRVPEDMRLVGFDNIESCRVTTPPLSSIDVGLVAQGMTCAELLLDRLEGRYGGPPRRIRLETAFVERASTLLG